MVRQFVNDAISIERLILVGMALNLHENNINARREPRNDDGEPVSILFRERMVKEKFGVPVDSLPKKLLVRRNTAIYATIAEAIFCVVSIPLGAVGRGLSRASLYINIVTLLMALIGIWACTNLKGPWITAHYLTTFSLTGLFVVYCIVTAAVLGSTNMLILLVLVAFMLSDVIAGIFTYRFMQEYEQFKKDIIAGLYNDVRRVPGSAPNHERGNSIVSQPNLENATDPSRSGGTALVSPIINAASVRSSDVAPDSAALNPIIRADSYPDCPELYKCPITTSIMTDPVTAEDGYTYERSAILEWFQTKKTSPMTNMAIRTTLIPNHSIKSAAMEYMESVDRSK